MHNLLLYQHHSLEWILFTKGEPMLTHHNQINKQVLERLWRKGNPSTLLVEMQTGAATVENSMEFPQKTKNGTAFLSSDLTAGIIP